MARVYVSIGSNIDREQNICAALRVLTADYGELEQSSVYESAAVGFDSAPFYNLVVGFCKDDAPRAVQDRLHAIENRQGRLRTAKLSARTLDLDLLLYDDRYAFVLAPLAEIAGSAQHPVTGTRYAEMWSAFDDGQQVLTKVDWPPVQQ